MCVCARMRAQAHEPCALGSGVREALPRIFLESEGHRFKLERPEALIGPFPYRGYTSVGVLALHAQRPAFDPQQHTKKGSQDPEKA